MKAHPGDTIALASVAVGDPVRHGVVLDARGPGDSEPFLMRWSDGHEGLFFPGPGSVLRIDHASSTERGTATARRASCGPAPGPPTPGPDRPGGSPRVSSRRSDDAPTTWRRSPVRPSPTAGGAAARWDD